ncbi:uncharacterized protein EAF01_010156 [Botrytis porri]|uniref:uncharacterized protein n=1 Tax=Botrytis porri TaxID=87229 RepID=UPI001900E74E|nr:uncharacterized protein EAF01_010156 [Botrytis porri]KAF7894706.1 hypothetical protein EAF01_010156 [Botrytis porri]
MDPYQYQPIDLGRTSIRLLQLHKGDWSDKIQGHFISAWFDDPDSFMPYFALSYTWGDVDKVEEVIIDSARIRVTLNLHMALQHLRSEEEDQIFWIDALCINQENVHEKLHQIRQMGDIYKKAEKVVVWLGRGTEGTDLVMDAMKRLRKASLGWHSAEWKDKASGWVDENNEHLMNLRDQMRLILERPWFRRIWILQEVANARRATTVHCGNRSISATTFSQFPALIALNPAVHCQSVLDIMPGISRKESWWAHGQKLHTLLVKFRESEATDDRDKIYALLGISSDAHRSKILDPKCDKSSQQVIREAVSFILSERYPQLIDDASLYQFLDWNLTKFLDAVEDLEGAILMDAFQGAEGRFLKLLIETDVCQISSRGFHDRTPVHWTVHREQLIILKMLLDASLCSFEKRDSDRQTPLSLAIQTGNAKIVELVLNSGVDIEATCLNGLTPLLLAIEKDKINIVDLLLRRGAKYKAQNMSSSDLLSQESDRPGQSISPISAPKNPLPLPFAIEKGNYGISKLLFDHGAPLRDEGPSSDIECGIDKMVEFLIDHGIGTDNSELGIRLQLAAKLGNVKLTREFIKRGFALESKNGMDQTPLILAVVHGHYETIKLLLESGAEIHSEDSLHQTPLMIAVQNRNKKIVELLRQKGADFERTLKDNVTPLVMATDWERYGIVELLIQRGADLEVKDDFGRTTLSFAASYGILDIAQLLLENGAELETRDQEGKTPLQNAIIWGYGPGTEMHQKGVVTLLLENGAELETRDEEGRTPLQNLKASDWENEASQRELVALLLEWGAIDMDEG